MYFVTGNPGKFQEAAALMPWLEQATLEVPEIQSNSLEEVARFSVEYAHKELGEPCFVEDAGIFVDALNGFPGVYSRYAYDTIGPAGILRLMDGVEHRSAHFGACIAYHDGTQVHVFKGRCGGTIAQSLRGTSGFGFDPIFVPAGREKTFAEDLGGKQELSHRIKALEAFLEFLKPKLPKPL